MDPNVYKVFHILGFFLVFSALGGTTIATLLGRADDARARRLTGVSHGVGLLLILVSGFGMLAKLGLAFDGWVFAKMGIWLILGAAAFLIRKRPSWASLFWFVLPLLGACAGFLALYKPF